MSEKNTKDTSFSRKEFLSLSLIGTGTLALFGFSSQKKSGGEGVEGSEHSWAMVIDKSKCVGCEACVNACQASNDINPEIRWNKLYKETDDGGEETFISMPCMHCEHAPCVSVCPVQASYYRDDGIVMMNYDLCIGCRYCQVACPYGARSFNWEEFTGENPFVPEWGEPDIERRPRGVVEKCTFCVQRIDRGLSMGLTPGIDPSATPVCVNACPFDARIFGDLNDPNSNVSVALANSPHSQLREELGTGPRVYYLPANRIEGNES